MVRVAFLSGFVANGFLRRLIADQIAVSRRTNVVKSELFSEKFQRIMNLYLQSKKLKL